MRSRSTGILASLALGAIGTALALGSPRLLWLNRGPRLEYPWACGAGGLLVALAFGGLFRLFRGRPLGWLGLALATFGLAVALDRWIYRTDADERGLHTRGWTGATSLSWRDVTRVDLESGRIVVHGPKVTLALVTTGLPGEDRARLERTISRRVGEAATTPKAAGH